MKTPRARFVVTYFLVRAADMEVRLVIRPIEHGYRIGGLGTNLGLVHARVTEPGRVIWLFQDDPTVLLKLSLSGSPSQLTTEPGIGESLQYQLLRF